MRRMKNRKSVDEHIFMITSYRAMAACKRQDEAKRLSPQSSKFNNGFPSRNTLLT
jgi:hypothetical protein